MIERFIKATILIIPITFDSVSPKFNLSFVKQLLVVFLEKGFRLSEKK